MVKFNLKMLIADKSFKEDKKITYGDVSAFTGISASTLSKLASKKGYHTSSVNIEKLCYYFACTPNDLMTIIPDPAEGKGE